MMASCKIVRRCLAATVLGAAVLSLGGCGGGGGASFDPGNFFSGLKPDTGSGEGFTVFQGAAEAPAVRPATAADLVGPDGRCEGGAAAGASAQRISLTMTECEMVAVSGPPDQVNVGAGDIQDRRTVLTYNKGEHAGIYTFVSGRLKIMDELPGPVKPEPKKRVVKKPAPKRPAAKPPASKPPASKPPASKPAPRKPQASKPAATTPAPSAPAVAPAQ